MSNENNFSRQIILQYVRKGISPSLCDCVVDWGQLLFHCRCYLTCVCSHSVIPLINVFVFFFALFAVAAKLV
jgi:hypothetical protein